MKRFSIIAGWIVITIAFLLWNGLVGDTSIVRDNVGRAVASRPSGAQLSTVWLYAALAVWYALHWMNFILEWNRRPVMSIGGRYSKTIGPGLVMLEPLYYGTLNDVPVQDVVKVVKAASIQTKDNVSLGLEGVITYRIKEDKVKDAVVEVGDVDDAIIQRALSTLADVGAITSLDQFLEHRDKFCKDIKDKLLERIGGWGADVKAFELKAFKINDPHVENAIAMKAKALKEAEAELARAEMQKKIAEKLNEAADAYNENGRWLKGMEVLVELTRSAQNNTILIPSDVTSALGAMMRPFPGGAKPTVETKAAA